MHNLIAVTNTSRKVDDETVRGWADACRRQAWYHAAPLWNLARIPVVFFSTFEPVPSGAWPIAIIDSADAAGALGYHDRDAHGNPYGRVFINETEQAGMDPCAVLSHEVLEAVGDPICNVWRDYPSGRRQIAQELCDPVQGNTYTDGQGFELSDFVLPAWFTPGAEGPYSFMDLEGKPRGPMLHAPFEIASHGYGIVRTAGDPSEKFASQIVFGARYDADERDRVGLIGSRTARRKA